MSSSSTQALRQVLARAVVWGMLDVNAAKLGSMQHQKDMLQDQIAAEQRTAAHR